MSLPDSSFVTSIDGLEGTWPDPPRWFSYSSFREAEECPRRWSLSRATYPTVWDKAGYPERPNLAAVIGDVIHAALEQIVRELTGAGLDSSASAGAVNVLRSMGGYSGIVERSIADRAKKLEGNPRMASRIESFVRELRGHLPEIRQRTQAALSRTRLVARAINGRPDGSGSGVLADGSYPEFEIVSDSLGWAGRVDLLTVHQGDIHILDYKTGAPSEHHANQMRAYALLWFRRNGAEPDRPATKLTLSYPTHDVEVPAPDTDELRDLERDLEARSAEARRQLQQDRPARPSPANCTFCSVRHLCDVYWRTIPTATEGPTDAEFTIKARNGPRSFRAQLSHTNEGVLIRTGEETSKAAGSRWRLLSGYGVRGDDGELRISVTASSELYEFRAT